MQQLMKSIWFKVGIGVAFVVLAAVLPLLAITIPGVFPGPSYTPGTLSMLAYAMLIAALALSYHLLFGAGGMLSFGHALFFGAGAYGLAITMRLLAPNVPESAVFILAILITLVLALIVGNLVGALALRVTGISFAMVTLAFAQAFNVMVRRNTGGLTGGEEGVTVPVNFLPDTIVGVLNTRNLYWLALGILIVAYLACVWVQHSRIGHMLAATRENDLRVRVLGVRPYFVRLFVFAVAALLAAVAGMGFVLLQSGVTPRVTIADFTLTLLVIVVLGGVGYRWGAIIGAIIYTILDQRLSALAASGWIQQLPDVLRIPLSEPLFILGMLFVLVVMFVPGGIAGIAKAAVGRSRGAVRTMHVKASTDEP